MPAGDIKQAEPVDDEFIPADAWPICLKCLKPCHPLQYYCDKCDSNNVINPLASYYAICAHSFLVWILRKNVAGSIV